MRTFSLVYEDISVFHCITENNSCWITSASNSKLHEPINNERLYIIMLFSQSPFLIWRWTTHLSGWRSGNALASHRCNPGSIPSIGMWDGHVRWSCEMVMWDGHVVTKWDRWVSSEYSGFLPQEDHRNANIGANDPD